MVEQPETVEVRPQKNGKWRVSAVADSFDDRTEAERVARELTGSVEAFDKDGNLLGLTRPTRQLLLLRQDGSVYGELGAGAPAGRGTGDPHVLDLEPAVIDTRARRVEK